MHLKLSQRAIPKTVEATGDLVHITIAHKITKASKELEGITADFRNSYKGIGKRLA